LATGELWEIRAAVVPETDGVEVVYEHEHETGVVNLLRVGREREDTSCGPVVWSGNVHTPTAKSRRSKESIS
jgi:hypothetical protein